MATPPAVNPTISSSTSSVHANVIPSEVGWQFVPQYYTFVNKHPHRLHCFYTKNSTFIHGTEGEDGRPAYGQQEIHKKIVSIGFQDCKVYIHSVDAQSSAAGGIIIQVIGEMSNKGEPWRKFAQTFFLAEQPNGYFVLNDIFRFLKEDSAGEDDEEENTEPAPEPESYTTPPPPAPAPAPILAPTPVVPFPAPVVPVESPVPEPVEEPPVVSLPAPIPVPAAAEKKPLPNGHHVDKPALSPVPVPVAEEAPAPAIKERAVTPAAEVTPEMEPQSAPEPPREPTPAPEPAPAAKPATPAPPAPAPVPEKPVPKTWANLAAANATRWGGAVADAKGVVSSAAPAAPRAPPPVAPAARGPPAPPAPPSYVPREGEHQNYTAAMSITSGACFVKSVTEGISAGVLREVLTARYGPIKELDIVRSKACAFLEFTTADAARKAIVASLPVPQGGEGGIRIDDARITVEMRKERGDRPPPRPRGGVPPGVVNGAGTGRGAPGGAVRGAPRGRGAPPAVGGK